MTASGNFPSHTFYLLITTFEAAVEPMMPNYNLGNRQVPEQIEWATARTRQGCCHTVGLRQRLG